MATKKARWRQSAPKRMRSADRMTRAAKKAVQKKRVGGKPHHDLGHLKPEKHEEE